MIKKVELPENFLPRYDRKFHLSEREIVVGVDYGDSKYHIENFFYAIYEGNEIVASGLAEWDNRNGMLMLSEVAKAVALHWDYNG